jgi:putative ABC transport system permease protein
MRAVRKLWLKLILRKRLTADLENELAFHREMTVAQGNPIGLGNAAAVKESVFDICRFNLIENLWRDVVLAARRLRKSAGYSIAAIGSLALGMGITTAMFTLLNAVFLRPLPYTDPQRLVWLTEVLKANSTDEITITPDFLDWRRFNHAFQDLAGINEDTHIVSGLGQPLEVHSARASASLLPVLGVKPMLGRNFTRDEDIAGGERVAIVTYRFWRDHLGADVRMIGKSIRIDERAYALIGVLPPKFVFPSDNEVQLITPLAKNEAAELARDGRVLTIIHSVIGRLKPGVTLQQAREDIAAIQAHLPVPPFHPTITVKALALRSYLFGDEGLTATVLVTGSLLFLLVACANLGSLALSQLLQREREVAMRRALGATRSRLIAQLLVENVLVAIAAWGLGVLLAFGIRNLLAGMPSYEASLYAELPIDASVLLFTIALLLVVVGLFGLIPAVRMSDVRMEAALKTGQPTIAGARDHFQLLSVVAAAEIAIVVGLSTGAVLTVRSFWNMRYRDLGIQSQHVIAATLNLSSSKYGDPRRELGFIHQVLANSKLIPGVEKAAISIATEIPPGAWHATNTVILEGRPLAVNSRQKALMRPQNVSADYFNILHIPRVAGRLLWDSDASNTPQVVVVNLEFARRYFPHENAIGHRLMGDRNGWYTIVGVVGDVKSSGLSAAPEPIVYMPYEQTDGQRLRELGVILQSALPVSTIGTMFREVVARADAEQPISKLETIDDRLNNSVARPRFTAVLLTGLAVLGTVLAILGVYGLAACRIRSQVREIAVRQALGARPSQIVARIMQSALVTSGSGLFCGLLLTVAGTRLISAMLFEVSPRDPVVLFVVSGCVLAAAVTACLIPALRAAGSDPLSTLRET